MFHLIPYLVSVHLRTAVALSWDRQAMMVCAPISAKDLAVSYPIPVFPPVTTATFPERSTVGYESLEPII